MRDVICVRPLTFVLSGGTLAKLVYFEPTDSIQLELRSSEDQQVIFNGRPIISPMGLFNGSFTSPLVNPLLPLNYVCLSLRKFAYFGGNFQVLNFLRENKIESI